MRIIFFQPHNRFLRHDGDEFTARAKDCQRFWNVQGYEVRMCPLPKANDANKRQFVRGVLDSLPEQSVDRIAVFGHGTRGSCDLGLTVATLASVVPNLDRVLTDDARIGLYCCLTGKTWNGLAARLSFVLSCPVLAHTTSGHTTRNPYKRAFSVDHPGQYYIDLMPTDKAARKEWIAKLQTNKTAPFEALESAGLEGWAKS